MIDLCDYVEISKNGLDMANRMLWISCPSCDSAKTVILGMMVNKTDLDDDIYPPRFAFGLKCDECNLSWIEFMDDIQDKRKNIFEDVITVNDESRCEFKHLADVIVEFIENESKKKRKAIF